MIKNELQYNAIMKRIDELLQVVNDDTHENDPDYIELMILTDLVEAYEEIHYPIGNIHKTAFIPKSEKVEESYDNLTL